MQTNNPAFNNSMMRDWDYSSTRTTTMTVQGTALKGLVLLAILMTTGSWAWSQLARNGLNYPMAMGAGIAAIVVGLATSIKPTWAPVTSPFYAALEGVFLGTFTNLINMRYPGLPYQAVGLTVGTLFCMLAIYTTGLIKVTPRFVVGMLAAIGAIFLVYLISFVLGYFMNISFINNASPMGIAFSVIVVAVAAFSLLLNFDFIEKSAQMGAPKSMEWYGAYGLMVGLVWLYVEILMLLMKLQDRR